MLEPILKPIRAFSDSRGYSYFDIFGEPTSGQINIGNLQSPAIKAFHYHKKQWDHWFCLKGDIHIITAYVNDDDSLSDIKHFYIGEHNPCVLSIPPRHIHGYCNINNGLSTLLYWVTKPYDSKNPDEFRFCWDILGKEIWYPENK